MANSNKFNIDRTFGIEIEVIMNSGITHRELASLITAAGVPCEFEGYNHFTRNHWKIVSDASLQGNGAEIVSPILRGDDGIEQLRKVCNAIASFASVNVSCGLHVHHDVQDYNLDNFKNIFKLWTKYEKALDSVMPASRRGSNARWCRPNRLNADLKTTFKAFDSADSLNSLFEIAQRSNRYFKLNMASYFRQGTIEVRHHSGTVEFEKIVNWVILTQAMVESVKSNKTISVTGEDKLENVLKKTSSRLVKKFYRARAQHFNANNLRAAA